MQIPRYVSFLHAEYSKSSVIVLNKVMNMVEELRLGMDTRLQRLENKSRSKALTPITPSWIWLRTSLQITPDTKQNRVSALTIFQSKKNYPNLQTNLRRELGEALHTLDTVYCGHNVGNDDLIIVSTVHIDHLALATG